MKKVNFQKMAKNIQDYIELLESVMVIPPNLKEVHGKHIFEAIKTCKKLVKKLKKGDESVFKEDGDWDDNVNGYRRI